MIPEQAFGSGNRELSNVFFILLVVFFKSYNFFNLYFEEMFFLTLKCPSAFQNPSQDANTVAVILNIILDNFLPDNSTYHVIFSKGVK